MEAIRSKLWDKIQFENALKKTGNFPKKNYSASFRIHKIKKKDRIKILYTSSWEEYWPNILIKFQSDRMKTVGEDIFWRRKFTDGRHKPMVLLPLTLVSGNKKYYKW